MQAIRAKQIAVRSRTWPSAWRAASIDSVASVSSTSAAEPTKPSMSEPRFYRDFEPQLSAWDYYPHVAV